MFSFGALMFAHDEIRIHPDDASLFESHLGSLNATHFINFEDLGREGEYLKLQIEGLIYRIGFRVLREYAPSKFRMGQKVRTLNGTNREGWIRQIAWHFASQRHNYYLEIERADGTLKKLSRRYLEGDLEACNECLK